MLLVECSVIGRAQIVGCANLEAWRDPAREHYLLADVAHYDDDDEATSVQSDNELAESAADALYRLVDALLLEDASDGIDANGRTAAVAVLEKAAGLAEDTNWWEALELW